MGQFDVYEYPRGRRGVRYVVDVQADLLDRLGTRAVIPMYPVAAGQPTIGGLNPEVLVDGERFYLSTAELAAMRSKQLGKRVGSVSEQRADIINALDLLLAGI